MSVDDVIPFRKGNHCKLIWLIQNVYQCRILRKACIDGPDYATKCSTSFPWALKLGRSTSDLGISLYIRGVNLPKDILAKFHAYVRHQNTGAPSLDIKHQAIFGSGTIWESPLLITDDDFEMKALKSKSREYWEIHVELMWNEIVEPQTNGKKYTNDVLSKLLRFKEIGTDLRQFCKNARFSDIDIWCGNEKIPAHKAILTARCPYFAEKINSYSGGEWEETTIGLSPARDLDVMESFLTYLYTGDIESLMEGGPLPLGIHKCAQRMRKYDLEWLTSPLQLFGYSRVLSNSMKRAWDIGNLYEIAKRGDKSQTLSSENLSFNNVTFSIHVNFRESNCISVFLQLDELRKRDCVHVIYELTTVNRKNENISKTIAGDLKLKSSIGFPEFTSIDNFMGIRNVVLVNSILYYDGELSTDVDKRSINCMIKPEVKSQSVSPASELGDGCHGWINLSNDLGQLLMTGNYSDCTIVVGKVRFKAHRVILAARSHYFSRVLNEKKEDYTSLACGIEIFVEKDIEIGANAMKTILEEIYTGSANIKDSQSAKDLHKFAEFFGLKRLERKCQNYPEKA